MAEFGNAGPPQQYAPLEGEQGPPPQQPTRPLCVTMDEMTSVQFDSGVFWTVIMTMYLPFPFVFRLFKVFEKSPGVLIEILHLALLAYPILAYILWLYFRGNDVDGIRWQSEVFFPCILYVIVSVLVATYHSYRNITQLVNLGGGRKDGTGPVISDEQWEALCRAGEFLEYHNVFDSDEAITEQESEDFKTEVVMKMLTSSRLLALIHPCISPVFYYYSTGSAFLTTPTEKYLIVSAMIVTFLLIAQVMLMCIRGIMLYRYRVKSLEKYTRLSAVAVPENPFQLQFAEGAQFWLDTRFIVLRHDLKRITAVQAVVGLLTMITVAGALLMLLEITTGIGFLRYFESIDRLRIALDYVFYGGTVLHLVWMGMTMTTLQNSHAGVLMMKGYEMSLAEPSGPDIKANKTIILLKQMIDFMSNHDSRPTLLGHAHSAGAFQLLAASCIVAITLTTSFLYEPDQAWEAFLAGMQSY